MRVHRLALSFALNPSPVAVEDSTWKIIGCAGAVPTVGSRKCWRGPAAGAVSCPEFSSDGCVKPTGRTAGATVLGMPCGSESSGRALQQAVCVSLSSDQVAAGVEGWKA